MCSTRFLFMQSINFFSVVAGLVFFGTTVFAFAIAVADAAAIAVVGRLYGLCSGSIEVQLAG